MIDFYKLNQEDLQQLYWDLEKQRDEIEWNIQNLSVFATDGVGADNETSGWVNVALRNLAKAHDELNDCLLLINHRIEELEGGEGNV